MNGVGEQALRHSASLLVIREIPRTGLGPLDVAGLSSLLLACSADFLRDGIPLTLLERNSMFDRDALIKVFQERALKFGDFTLVSGKKSSYYLDGKQVMLHAQGLRLVSEGLLDLLSDVEFQAIGGMSIGADPIIGGVLTVAAEQNREMIGVMVRKEAKGHGTQKFIEGPLEPGMKVVVVDDVVTTGGSSLLAVERIQEFGADVVEVVGIVDRMQGGAETFAKNNLPFRSLLSIRDFGIEPPAAE